MASAAPSTEEVEEAPSKATQLASKLKTAAYIESSTGAKVSRKAHVYGVKQLHLHRKAIVQPGAVIRADLAPVSIGQHCYIGENTVVRPPYKRSTKKFGFCNTTIREYTIIGDDSVVEAAYVGSCVRIGKHCVIDLYNYQGKRCVIKDYCVIKDGSVIAADTVLPPFSVSEGAPGLIVGEVLEHVIEDYKDEAMLVFQKLFET